MATGSEKRPWRQVTHIELTTGARGGKVWFLTLECGHHKAVRMPVFRIEKGNWVAQADREAPTKCRCLICKPVAT